MGGTGCGENWFLLWSARPCSVNLIQFFADGWGYVPSLLFGMRPNYGRSNGEKKENEVSQSCTTLCDPMVCSPPGSSIHGIFQARVLSGLPFLSPGYLPDPGIKPGSPTLWADAFTV